MTERIKHIMTNEQLTPSQFADKACIQRSNLSHILNGRSKPTIDIVMKILETFPSISTDWLLSGNGSMYKDGSSATVDVRDSSIFLGDEHDAQTERSSMPSSEPGEHVFGGVFASKVAQTKEPYATRVIPPDSDPVDRTIKEVVIKEVEVKRSVSRIMIFYSDNTFENFIPESGIRPIKEVRDK